ncbi:unnamed protein product [Brachionus calyciflorus]|uniref:hydroxymethylbilane synthase n=1 Tax=Brachionus calyciflorus TaxID=104777 RepID=A0A813NJ65_9BILA|nr:unnamed protein product [Brachionus calyciflorus]
MSTQNEPSESQNEKVDIDQKKRTHFKIGSRKSKLAMVQSEYIQARLTELYPEYTFEIVNFDTKGDKILNIALPKIGDKGLFTKELEDALEDGRIDFVVHSLKDMPCQTLPDNLTISGVPEREDPSDALVIAERLRETKKTIDDLEENSIVGTSSLRRIAQLKEKYPKLKFETIRGNLQTRFSKMDNEKKFDAIILATAGLNRMKYNDRISQILPSEICMHAVSQGALGIESRRDDLDVIKMINRLNHEETLLRCVAERTFLAKLEGGCSAPIAVKSSVSEKSIILEGAVFNLEGTTRIQDKFEMHFEDDKNCPLLNVSNEEQNVNQDNDEQLNSKRTSVEKDEISSPKRKKTLETNEPEIKQLVKHYCYITDLSIDENKMLKAELCGLHLAQKLKEKGADILIEEIKIQVHSSM